MGNEQDFHGDFQVLVTWFFASDDVTKGRKDLDPHGRLREVRGRMG